MRNGREMSSIEMDARAKRGAKAPRVPVAALPRFGAGVGAAPAVLALLVFALAGVLLIWAGLARGQPGCSAPPAALSGADRYRSCGGVDPLVPRRTDLESILIIGSGPIVIGQACEFDYSGTQACKVLREDGFRVILVNSNPATIMTDPEFADRTYIEPITPEFVEAVIAKERPDALLPTLGGPDGAQRRRRRCTTTARSTGTASS